MLGRRAIRIMMLALVISTAGMIASTTASAQNGRLRAAVQQRRAERQAQRQAQAASRGARPPNAPATAAPKGQPNVRSMDGLPPKWVDNMRNMTPDEQQRFMQNDARFTNLPPQRQEQIRNNLK